MCALGPQVGRKVHELHLARTCAGMFWSWRCWFVTLPSVWATVSSQCAALSPGSQDWPLCCKSHSLTLVSWRCHTRRAQRDPSPRAQVAGGPGLGSAQAQCFS